MVKGRKNQGGRAITSVNCLFTGLCVCGQCGGPVHYVNKARGAVYLRCDRASRKLSKCSPASRPYPQIEAEFFAWIRDYDFSGATKTERIKKQSLLASLTEQRDTEESKVDRLTEAMALGSKNLLPTFIPKLETAKAEVDRLTGEIGRMTADLASLDAKAPRIKYETGAFSKNPEDRRRIRQEIRRRVEKLTFVFGGDESFADPYFIVELKDGRTFAIHSTEAVDIWTKDGKHYFVEPEPPADLEPAQPLKWPKKRKAFNR